MLDDEDEAESIHYRRLTMRWRELLGRSPVEVFYCGSEDFRSVRDAVLGRLRRPAAGASWTSTSAPTCA